jgi:hypothetical protein
MPVAVQGTHTGKFMQLLVAWRGVSGRASGRVVPVVEQAGVGARAVRRPLVTTVPTARILQASTHRSAPIECRS